MVAGWNRWKHFAAMVLIGDGVMAMVRPGRDARAWATGPLAWKRLMWGLRDRPNLTRLLGAAEVVVALRWALAQETATGRATNPHLVD